MPDELIHIASQFKIQGTIARVEPFGKGHINDTYRIFTAEPQLPDYILQRKNHYVFKDIPGMMENIIRITDHIRNKLKAQEVRGIDNRVITHFPAMDGDYYFQDDKGNYWTVFLLIPGRSVEKIENPEHAYLAGKAFGLFQKQLEDLPGGPLNETIVDFHDISFRYRNFRKALDINHHNRKAASAGEVNYALEREEEMHTLLRAQREGEIPVRVTHNDTKINNILFDRFGQVLCVIDLDTVMPGLVHFDFGDAIRTAACTSEEDEPDLDKVTINIRIFEAFAKGFLEETKSFLNKREVELLPHAAQFMAFIMGLRFLTDYLEGDVYYKISHPEHNLERCRAQFKLAREIGAHQSELQAIIQEIIQQV